MTKVVAERRAAAAAVDGYKVLHSMLRGEYTEESNGARTVRQSGGKDRHSKVFTSRGPRDRRVRLSVATAIRFYDLQDRLGFDQPSKAVEWLLLNSQPAIQTLPQLGLHHLHPPPNPPPNSPLHPSLISPLPPPLIASLNHPLISTLIPPLDVHCISGSHDQCHPHPDFNTSSHAPHSQDCEDQPPHHHHAINITHHHHHTSWPSNPTPNPILKHTSCPNLTPNPPQTSLEDDPQYSNYSSASSDAPRLSSSPPNPTALQRHKRKRATQSPTNHHQFSISDLQDDYTNCSSNFTSQPYLPAERLTIFNEAPMNYCSTSEYNDNNINNNIPSDNWLPIQDQLNAPTHHHLQFPNNAIQLYKSSFANHEDNTRLARFDEPNFASHLIISQQVTNSLAQSCDMQLAPQQLDELDYGVPSPSESTSMKASCCKGMQASNCTNGYGGQTTGNYNCVSSASSATSNVVVETNAFSGWASNAGSYRQAKFQYSTDQI